MGVAVELSDQVRVTSGRRAMLAVGLAAAAGALAATAATAAAAADAAAAPDTLVVLARVAIVGAPCAVGLYAWYRRPDDRFARLLLAASALWLLATLGESADPVPYTLGHTAGWLGQVVVVALMLSFPTGRLPGRVDRLLLAAMAVVVAVTFLPRLALAASFEVPSPFTSCTSGCPPNVLFGMEREPWLVDAILRPAGGVLVLAVTLGVTARLWSRAVSSSSRLAHRVLAPVVAIAAVQAALLATGISMRFADRTAPGLEVVSWLLALTLPALALAFLIGLVRWRLFTARALTRLALLLHPGQGPSALRRAFAEAFDDPDIVIVFPREPGDPRAWVDIHGRPAELPAPCSGRAVSVVGDGGRTVAAVVHDVALGYDPVLLRAGTAITAIAFDRRRLAGEAGSAMREVRRSRTRIAAAAERERRRIERDLHDGAQQRLVALRIELQLAEEAILEDPVLGAARIRDLGHDVDAAIDELRALAHGVYPPVLADHGLVEGLRAATRGSPLPVRLTAHGMGRYRPEVESAVYFCVMEGVQNALKHAVGAHAIEVELDEVGTELRFTVRDDGTGVADEVSAGRGLRNMHDRVAAVGGEIELTSRPHVGSVLRGSVAPGG